MNRFARVLLIFALSVAPLTAFAAPATITVTQNFRAFHPGNVTIHAGDTLKIRNDDVFVHQIYIDSPTMTFESGEQPPGTAVSITFPKPGTFQVQCHIHPMMLMTVVVQPQSGS